MERKVCVYDKIEQATGGRVFRGVGLPTELQQVREWMDYEYVRALMDSPEVSRELKQEFFDLWFADEEFGNPDLDDPEFAELYVMLLEYAEMEPRVVIPGRGGQVESLED